MPVAGESMGSGARVSAPLSDAPRGRQPFSVGFGIFAALVISLLAIGVLYYKWFKDKVDSNQMIIAVWGPDGTKEGEANWTGAKVTVRGVTNPEWVASDTLEEKEHVLLRFHVPPGVYRVRVEKNGKVLAERESPPRSYLVWWPFRAPEAVTRPSLQ